MQPAPLLAPLCPEPSGAAPVPSLSSLQLPARAAEPGTGGSSPPVTPGSLLGAPSPENQRFPQPVPQLAPHRPQLLPACPGGAGGLRELPVPASYPRGEGGFGISLPTALLSFPARLSAWIPTAPALTVPGGTGRWLSRSQSRTGTLGHRAWGGHMPARGLALLGELWHPVGGLQEGRPLRVPCPLTVHGWAPREGLQGSHVTQAPTWPPSCPGSQSYSWCLPISPKRVLARAGAQGSCPPVSLQPPAGAVLGTAGQGRGAGGCWRGSALLSQGC